MYHFKTTTLLIGFIVLATAQAHARRMDDNFNDYYVAPRRTTPAASTPANQPAVSAPGSSTQIVVVATPPQAQVELPPPPPPVPEVPAYVPAPVQVVVEPPPPASPSMSHVEYFGYYASAFETVGKGNYTQELSDHTNVTWIVVGDEVGKLKEAKSIGIKAIIDIQRVFMDDNFKMLPNYVEKWKAYAKTIEPYRDAIAALYPMDEPFGNAAIKGVSDAQMLSNLEIMASVVKSTFPEIPIAVIYSPPEVKDSKPIPAGFDWIGFDCYGKFKDCYKDKGVAHYFNNLKSRLTGNQRMMLVPWGYKEGYPDAGDIKDRVAAAGQYWDLAKDPSVIAFIPFLYQSFEDLGTKKHMAGTIEMPDLLKTFKGMGQQIKSNYPNGPTRHPLMSAKHDIVGSIDGVYLTGTHSWVIQGWACATGINDSISVDLYAGGAAGAGGIAVARVTANKNSESGISDQCRAIGNKYRFEFPIDETISNNHGGKKIYIHGISPVGGANSTIAKSGSLSIPKIYASTTISDGSSYVGSVGTSSGSGTSVVYVCGKQDVSPTLCEVTTYCGKKKIGTTKKAVTGSYADYDDTKYANGSVINGFTVEGYTMLKSYYSFRCTPGGWVSNDPNNPKNWCSVREDICP